MLRAGPLALQTVDAVGSLPLSLCGSGIGLPCFVHLSVPELEVHRCEDLRDRDLFRASAGAVVAGRAGDCGRMAEDPLRLPDDLLLLFIQRLEGPHEREVVLHLRNVRHAGEHRQDPVQRCDKSDGPGRVREIRVAGGEQLLYLLRRICKGAALYGLHDDDGLVVLSCDLIVLPGADPRIVPVRVVDLELRKVRLRVLREEPVQELRPRVEGEPEVPDQSLFLLCLHEVPEMEALVLLVVVLHETVEQVVVEVPRPGPLKALIKLVLRRFLRGCHEKGIHLGGKGKGVPGIPLHQGLSNRLLRPRVDIGGVKVGKACLKEPVHHAADLCHVGEDSLPRKAHEPEAEFPGVPYNRFVHLRPFFPAKKSPEPESPGD